MIAPLAAWVWGAIGLGLLTLEMLVPGNILIWFAVGSLGVAGATFALGKFAFFAQAAIFALLSLIGLLVGRRFLHSHLHEQGDPLLSRRAERYVGKTFVLTQAIRNGVGTARVGDSDWRVTGPDAESGDSVRVVGVEGTMLKIEPATT